MPYEILKIKIRKKIQTFEGKSKIKIISNIFIIGDHKLKILRQKLDFF